MNNERMPKQILAARTGGKTKRERPRERWTDEVEKDLKINWNKKLAYSGQRPEGVAEEFVGSRRSKRTEVHDDDDDEEEEEEE
jgi:hypothetical protein